MWDTIVEYQLNGDKRLLLASRKSYAGSYKVYTVGIANDSKFITELVFTSYYDKALDVYKKELIRHKELYELSK